MVQKANIMTEIKHHTKTARKLRQNMTDAERKFWYQVRDRRFQKLKFKRQVSISPYIVDFACENHKLIVEIDGGQHCDNQQDKKRDEDLKSRDYHVMRFWNNDVLKNIEGVMMEISEFIKNHPPHPSSFHSGTLSQGRLDGTKTTNSDNKIHIGTIRGAHGVKGLVRLAVHADDVSLFDTLTDYKITLKNKHKGEVWLSHFENITNKEEADALKGTKLYCDRENLTAPSDDEIYFADMVGMKCIDEDGKIIGTVEAIENFGAGDLLDIKPPQGENKGQNFFLSYDDETVLNIEKDITIRVPGVV